MRLEGPLRRFVLAWVALTLLLALTTGLAYVPMGGANIYVALTIAVVKALIVLAIFMKLAEGPSMQWAAAAAGLFWLLILLGLTATDYSTRTGFPTQ
jgi:cytochrome c oxidase subunit 4